MYTFTTKEIIKLFRNVSEECEFRIGLASHSPKIDNNFLLLSIANREVTSRFYIGVSELVKVGEIDVLLSNKPSFEVYFSPEDEIDLPFMHYTFTFVEKVIKMRNSNVILSRETAVVLLSEVSINHTVQILEILFKQYTNRMQFTVISKKYPGELIVINYINGNPLFVHPEGDTVVLYRINLFKFKEFFGDYSIVHVGVSNVPVEYPRFIQAQEMFASSNNLQFKEVFV